MFGKIHWIADVPSGRLGTLARPMGGASLEDEVAAWKREGVDVIVSLLSPEEVVECGLEREWGLCEDCGIRFLSFPITDRDVPGSTKSAVELIRWLREQLTAGQSIAVHCWMGIGRSSLVAASVLVAGGTDPAAAFEAISDARGLMVPDTFEQRRWVEELARHIHQADDGGDA